VVDAEFSGRTVDTKQMRELIELLKRVDGGSVGLAGARGAGKSTILRWLPNAVIATDLTKDPPLAVIGPAPVAYAPREFLLHLFAETCLSALKDEDDEDMDVEPSTPAEIAKTRRLFSDSFRELSLNPQLIVAAAIATGLLIGPTTTLIWKISCVAVGLQALRVMASRQLLRSPWIAVRPIVDDFVEFSRVKFRRAALISVGYIFAAMLGWFAAAPPNVEPRLPLALATVGLALMEYRTNFRTVGFVSLLVPLLRYGGIATATAGLLCLALPHSITSSSRDTLALSTILVALGTTWLATLSIEWGRYFSTILSGSPTASRSDARLNYVKRELNGIRYQQTINLQRQDSVQFGYKAAFSLTALEKTGTTWADHPVTYAELVGRYRALLKHLTKDRPVIIGIDELDKLPSSDDAIQFINSIKGIFGVPGVRYFVTISTEAASTFKMKGSPFRDAYDSSFDEVVILDYFGYQDVCRLLNTRIVGLPRPFMALLYVLSGALPRDVVRLARKVVMITGKSGLTLLFATNRLVLDEVEDRMRSFELPAEASYDAKLISDIADVFQLRNQILSRDIKQLQKAPRRLDLLALIVARRHADYAGVSRALSRLASVIEVLEVVLKCFSEPMTKDQLVALEREDFSNGSITQIASAVRLTNSLPMEARRLARNYAEARDLA
jgi:hypothetical protein